MYIAILLNIRKLDSFTLDFFKHEYIEYQYICIVLYYCFLTACIEGDIRLVDGFGSYQGRVEVCHNNTWGTVCDDLWDTNDGIVTCRQLGLRFVNVVGSAFFGAGTGPIWLDNLRCIGSESQLIDCNHNGFGVHNCVHGEDAGLICEGN